MQLISLLISQPFQITSIILIAIVDNTKLP